MINVVIDTNVLVSVLLAESEDSSVIKLIDAVLKASAKIPGVDVFL